MEIFRSVLKGLFQSVGFLHSLDLVHTDLKPENVLFVRDPRSFPDYSVKLVDFGNISKCSEAGKSIVTTRQYRAPEVILGCCNWGKPCDVWSVGCVAMEIYLGELIFNTHSSWEHIGLIEKIMGGIPVWMVKKARPKMKSIFHYKEVLSLLLLGRNE